MSDLKAEIEANKEATAEARELRGIARDIRLMEQGFLTPTFDPDHANSWDGTTTDWSDAEHNPYAVLLIIESDVPKHQKLTAMTLGVQNRQRVEEFAKKGVLEDMRKHAKRPRVH